MCAKFEPALHMYLHADRQCHADVTYIYNLQGYHCRVHIIMLLCLHVVTLFTYSRPLRLWPAFYFIKRSPSPCTALEQFHGHVSVISCALCDGSAPGTLLPSVEAFVAMCWRLRSLTLLHASGRDCRACRALKASSWIDGHQGSVIMYKVCTVVATVDIYG